MSRLETMARFEQEIDDERPVCFCEKCNGEIYQGEDYYYIAEMNICEDCIADYIRTAEVDQ